MFFWSMFAVRFVSVCLVSGLCFTVCVCVCVCKYVSNDSSTEVMERE